MCLGEFGATDEVISIREQAFEAWPTFSKITKTKYYRIYNIAFALVSGIKKAGLL